MEGLHALRELHGHVPEPSPRWLGNRTLGGVQVRIIGVVVVVLLGQVVELPEPPMDH